MRVLLQDLRYAIRQLRKSPGFTAIAVVSLALAIGANTTIFSFANQMLFVKLGVPHPDQLRMFSLTGDEHLAIHSAWGSWMTGPDGTRETTSFSYPAYQHLRKEDSVTDPVFAFKGVHVNVTANGSAQSAQADLVSGNF
jgi:hypothetical protein